MSERKRLRAARRAILPSERTDLDCAITERLCSLSSLASAEHVALYFPDDGEVDVTSIRAHLDQSGRSYYVPLMTGQDNSPLLFSKLTESTQLRPNRVGILEPEHSTDTFAPDALDVVIMPLVGFNEQRYRLGRGGGFYDRSFQFRLKKAGPPYLIGVAYECQKSDQFEIHPWDVPCDLVVTQSSTY